MTTVYKKRNYRKRIPSKAKFVRKALAKRSNMKISKVVKQVLSRQVEKKCIQLDGTLLPVSLQAASASIANNHFTLTPVSSAPANTSGCYIGEGVGQDQRISDEINIKGMYFDYQIYPLPYNVSTNSEVRPVVVKLFFIRPKVGEVNGPDIARYVSSSTSAFFENQSNAGSGLVGNLSDLTRRLDKDNYELIAMRTHKVFYASVSGTGVPSNVYGFANNDFKFMASGRVKVFSPKKCAFDRNNNPRIQPVCMVCQWVYADNTVAPSTRQPIQLSLNNTIYYTDM